MKDLPIIVEEKEDTRIVYFTIEKLTDILTIDRIKSYILSVISGGARIIVINFAGIEYMSSSFLSVLIAMKKALYQAKGRVCLCCLSENVARLFSITELDKIFSIFHSESDALEFLQASSDQAD
ncbi:MAG: STAS domain-containing protein [Candidatus Aureabacteria bacterium]|nr:STAS domain-containing protein [Candidatus Auribacterota bacterium]